MVEILFKICKPIHGLFARGSTEVVESAGPSTRTYAVFVETVANLSLLIETEALLRSFSSLRGTSLALVAFSINEWSDSPRGDTAPVEKECFGLFPRVRTRTEISIQVKNQVTSFEYQFKVRNSCEMLNTDQPNNNNREKRRDSR